MTQHRVKPKTQTPQEGKRSAMSKGPEVPEKPFDFAEYFKGVKQEWYKITWPTRPQVIAETGVVLIVVTIFSLFVFGVDKIFQLLISLLT